MTDETKKRLGVAATSAGLGAGAGWAFIAGLDPETLMKFFNQTASSQIAQAGFFFTMAAWLHSTRVKKEIAKNFAALTEAINNVAVTLRQDLERHDRNLNDHTERLEKHGDKLDNLSGRVGQLETEMHKQGGNHA